MYIIFLIILMILNIGCSKDHPNDNKLQQNDKMKSKAFQTNKYPISFGSANTKPLYTVKNDSLFLRVIFSNNNCDTKKGFLVVNQDTIFIIQDIANTRCERRWKTHVATSKIPKKDNYTEYTLKVISVNTLTTPDYRNGKIKLEKQIQLE